MSGPKLVTRQPTGKPSWPILLIAGAEKAGKTYSAAQASASEFIDRTLWIGVGEDDPDEYGALPGARFEIVQHDGTYRGILTALTLAVAEPAKDGKSNLIVLDSATRLWDLLSDMAQVEANRRAAAKAAKYNRAAPDEDVRPGMDLWNTAKQRWQHVMDALRAHQGPSVITARLETVVVMNDKGEPTKDKTQKVKAEKSLPFDVGAIVEMPARGEAYLTGVRSLRYQAEPGARTLYKDFTVERLWTDLGVTEKDATSPRHHAVTDNQGEQRDQAAAEKRAELLPLIAEAAKAKGYTTRDIADRWTEDHGEDITHTLNIAALQAKLDDLTKPEGAAAA